MTDISLLCPCCSEKTYEACCGRFLEMTVSPSTPEELMRSRYTAFVKCNIDYICETMREKAAKGFNSEEAFEWAKKAKWLKLEVLDSGVKDNTGFVEFKAYLIDKGKEEVIHERSFFKLIDNKWYYTDGLIPRKKQNPIKVSKPNRNESCSCGSGKKYKKCCGQ